MSMSRSSEEEEEYEFGERKAGRRRFGGVSLL
jgi:hypothetical protein